MQPLNEGGCRTRHFSVPDKVLAMPRLCCQAGFSHAARAALTAFSMSGHFIGLS
ncbi:hypothetical protein R69888_02407 [Paraburkholderia haematera]|uniref:Uncharacterized protein n=1 Tax=Paraburkholderia haematera TaxID=2793077 RepID=A0ABN7L9Z7_9BURK|nr:hypothetical protein R69888_02407 [Paraburkholderia haematera]